MSKRCLLVIVISFVFLLPFSAESGNVVAPPMPARIGGSVTVDGTPLTQATDDGYTFTVTKQDGTAYVDFNGVPAQDLDGLNASDFYLIDIPIYDAADQPGGANPGDTAVIHVFKDGSELSVTSPANGEFTVGDSGTNTQMDLMAASANNGELPFSEDWETGTIDPAKWGVGGSPTPVIHTGGHNSSYALDHNGDSWCHSAVHTQSWFGTTNGIVAEFWLKPYQCVGCEWSTNSAGFTTMELTDSLSCPSTENYYKMLAYVQLQSKTEAINYQIAGIGPIFSEAYPDYDWHKYKIDINSAGYVSFYQDDQLKGTSIDPLDLNLYSSTKFQHFGQAAYGPMLIDDISISGHDTLDHDTLEIESGTLNGTSLSSSSPSITVNTGDIISGSVYIKVHNIHDSTAIFPVGWSWSWAPDNESGYSQIDSWADTDDSYYTVSINKTAPSTSGTYYITFACGATYGIDNLFASKCGSSDPTSSDWNNGNDIADLGSSAYSTSNSQHWVSINADGGCTFEPGIAMIKVVVNKRGSSSAVKAVAALLLLE